MVLAAAAALLSTAFSTSVAGLFTKTERGVIVESDRYRIQITNGVLTGILNKLTGEEYLDSQASIPDLLRHLPSGLGTQNSPEEFSAAAKLYEWPWLARPANSQWPNQHHPFEKGRFAISENGHNKVELEYEGLTDGTREFPDEIYRLALEIEDETGELIITPSATSPRTGVYGVNLTASVLGAEITIEAPIFDGMRITRELKPYLYINHGSSYWDYSFIALNGRKRGAVGIWADDPQLRAYKHFFYLINQEGISFSLGSMNLPPFEKLTSVASVPWRIQTFDAGWPQAAARFREWRETHVRFAPRPEWARRISFVNCGVNANELWLSLLSDYLGKDNLSRTVTFAPTIRAAKFDTKHWDNRPYPEFKPDMQRWKASGARLMSYLQPMIMWGVPPADDPEALRIVALHEAADTHSVFQSDPAEKLLYRDQHHLGHSGWQKWFLNWVHSYISEYGADGVYHDQTYHCPIDNRGLINGMTSTGGMADYFFKAVTQNPDSIHGTEHMTEANSIGASLGIGSGILWGSADNVRHQRIRHASPISSALHYPNGVLFGFPHFSDFVMRGDPTHFHWGMNLMERRAEIAGQYLQQPIYSGKIVPFDRWQNEIKLDRCRTLAFVNHGLRPVFPESWDRNTLSYFEGTNGERFVYEACSWGTRFVRKLPAGDQLQYGRITGVTSAVVPGGIAGWVYYTSRGPAGLHPDRFYCLDPSLSRPKVFFGPASHEEQDGKASAAFNESYIEDGLIGDGFALLRVRPIEKIGAVIKSETVVIHSPLPPRKIYVNGNAVEGTPETNGGYRIDFATPADICVIWSDLETDLAHIKDSATIRMVSTSKMDVFDPEWIKGETREEPIKLSGEANPITGFVEPERLQRVLPSKEFQTAFRIRNPGGDRFLKVWLLKGGPLKEFLVNGSPRDVLKDRSTADPLEIPFRENEVSVLLFVTEAPGVLGLQWVDPSSQGAQRLLKAEK